MMKKYRKRHMTLIEVLIATSLTMILLTAITFFYRQVTLMSKESESLQQERFKLAYLEKRLGNVLPKTIAPNNRDFYFYTSDISGVSLVFTYDHEIKLGEKLSNHQLGRLYIDESNRLVLASLISPSLWELYPNLTLRKEILMEDVSNLSFEFYVPPKKTASGMLQRPADLVEILPENSWHQTWKSSYNQLPAMIKIHLTQKENHPKQNNSKTDSKTTPIELSFSLPGSDMVIIY